MKYMKPLCSYVKKDASSYPPLDIAIITRGDIKSCDYLYRMLALLESHIQLRPMCSAGKCEL
jgi:hypothetical protein